MITPLLLACIEDIEVELEHSNECSRRVDLHNSVLVSEEFTNLMIIYEVEYDLKCSPN